MRDLERSEIEVRLRGRAVALERFGLAEEVPLALGLLIDTSLSMDTIMEDTKTAARAFLTQLVTPRDKAFVVAFDTQPRLVTAMTGDLGRLFRALGSLSPDGYTALYDALVFAALQFEAEIGRRALVLLTDGDDYRSRFEAREAVRQARAGGMPVYMISLAGLDWLRPAIRKTELEAIAKQTGGRVFYVNRREEISTAYSRIGRELRSQYVLTFPSPQELTEKDLGRITVKVKRPKVEVRVVVGGRSVQ